MVQEGSGLAVPVYEGFSWPCFWFGPFWYAAKGLWGMVVISFVLSVVSMGFAWFLVFPFLANRQHREHLARRGYRLEPTRETHR